MESDVSRRWCRLGRFEEIGNLKGHPVRILPSIRDPLTDSFCATVCRASWFLPSIHYRH